MVNLHTKYSSAIWLLVFDKVLIQKLYSTSLSFNLYCISLHFIAFHCISLHFIAFHCISLHFIAFHCISLHFIAFHCISLHFIAFHCISLHFIAFHCTLFIIYICNNNLLKLTTRYTKSNKPQIVPLKKANTLILFDYRVTCRRLEACCYLVSLN